MFININMTYLELTPEHEKLIPAYKERWIRMVDRPFDKVLARQAVTELYTLLKKHSDLGDIDCPRTIFTSSPIMAASIIALITKAEAAHFEYNELGKSKTDDIWSNVAKTPSTFGDKGKKTKTKFTKTELALIKEFFKRKPATPENEAVLQKLVDAYVAERGPIDPIKDKECSNYIANGHFSYECRMSFAAFANFSVEVLGVTMENYDKYMLIAENLSWVYTYEELCIVCERPKVHYSLDGDIHCDGEPAIKFSDGVELWLWHGIPLPTFMQCHSSTWDPKWLLDNEKGMNSEHRRILIEALGYENILSRLDSEIMSTYNTTSYVGDGNEYELHIIRGDFGGEDAHILTMRCPSTNHYHAVRVDPKHTSAREAVIEFNNGIDPESFEIQT